MARINTETDSSGKTPTDNSPDQVEYTLPILHFFPDGSCNSARIQLADINPENLNKSIVELMGHTGTVKHQLIEILPEQTAGPDTNEVLEALLVLVDDFGVVDGQVDVCHDAFDREAYGNAPPPTADLSECDGSDPLPAH